MGNDQQKNKHQGDENTRPSVGKDQPQDMQSGLPPAAPDNLRPSSNSGPGNTPNPDPGYPSQTSMNEKNPDQQQNRGEKPQVQQQQDESTRKTELRKAVEEDMPNKGEGNENTEYSGGG